MSGRICSCGLSLKDPTHVSANRVETALCHVCCQGSREPGGDMCVCAPYHCVQS
jgi:hypothetical protein